jgi:hypothetical protein
MLSIYNYTANYGQLEYYFSSRAALTYAFFNHAYIWVHYLTVGLPDMKMIYGDKPALN